MLPVKPFRQTPALCGPAVLHMVLEFFGMDKSERSLAQLCGATRALGTPSKNILMGAKKLGFDGFIKDFSDLSDLRHWVMKKKIPVIVAWFSNNDGHYSVVVHLNKTHIYLQDPELGRIRKLDLVTFKRIWFDFRGDYLPSKQAIVIRRMIVIQPRTR